MIGGLDLQLLNALQTLMRETSGLSSLYQQNDPFFVNKLKHWLVRTEEAFNGSYPSQASRLAGLRSHVGAAEKGFYAPVYGIDPKAHHRKAGAAIAAFVLSLAVDEVTRILIPLEDQWKEAQTISRQILVRAVQKNLFASNGFGSDPATWEIDQVWSALSADEEIKAGIARLLVLVTIPEAKGILHALILSRQVL